MYPWYKGYKENIKLTYDDIQGIQALYGELSLHTGKVVHQAGAYPGFFSMKRQHVGVFLFPHGWDASPSQG